MRSSIEHFKDELIELANEGIAILVSEFEFQKKTKGTKSIPTLTRYQNWYTRALPVVRQLIPDRLEEFTGQYRLDRRKQVEASTYTISDYLTGLKVTSGEFKEEVFSSFDTFCMKFQQQIAILQSAQTRIDTILADIKGVLKADLFDDELVKAKELLRKDHRRPAGIIAGVVLESHLSAVCENHAIKFTKKNLNISDYNDALKEEVYDTATWRLIQRLGDIRNLCAHPKEREPTKEEVNDLIDGVEKATKTIF